MLNDNLVKNIGTLIDEVLLVNYPTDKILSNFFKEHNRLNNQIRYVVAETVYGLLRNYHKLELVLTGLKNNYDVIGLLWLNILKLEADVYNAVKIIDFNRLKKVSLNTVNNTIELPQWVISILNKQYSKEEILAIDKSMSRQAPLDLRVNLIKTNVESVIDVLTQDKINVVKTKYSPFGLRIMDKVFLTKHELFEKGLIEVQDEASQLAGMLLSPKRGDMVVDFCAGAGGKTLLLGMLMRKTGRIYAFDVNEKRLNNLSPRLAKSGLSNVYPQLINSENDTKIQRLHGKIDKVFVDAPCSGLGTLRRNPELKFRNNPNTIKELNKKQLSILTSASKLLKTGGCLVYATCSILSDENQAIVHAFLDNNSDFEQINANKVLDRLGLDNKDGFLQLLPNTHGTDGFFAALIQRIK